jgi:hypothetical protein
MSFLDRFFWRCPVCGAHTRNKHTRCKDCGAVRGDVAPFPRPSDLDGETTGEPPLR